MTDTNISGDLEGRCLCGAVTISARLPGPELDACHCDMCRRWGGIAFLSTRSVTDPVFTGAEHIKRFVSSDWAERGFCRECGTHLFYFHRPRGTYSFPVGLFDVPQAIMAEEIFIDEKPDYYAFAADTEKLTGAEVRAKFTDDHG
ncbi:GFA family protein [Stakelama saccharophila]|uniref:GFA family protein n=1 Tax=Stakelama saccharophila TaxID=3075605 RepID=A0ABZ0B9T1_9SPHN|nr:GFA family protein [Stakelama sp. W311]WNO53830.1 GFA family protein [Stakelama sp. W311]